MPDDLEHHPQHVPPEDDERTRLLLHDPRVGALRRKSDAGSAAQSILTSHLSKDELALGKTPLGERLPYNDYSTIDWLHDLVGVCTSGRPAAST